MSKFLSNPGYRLGGVLTGTRNVATGHWQSLHAIGGRVAALRRNLLNNPATPESCAKGGRAAAAIVFTPEHQSKAGSIGGRAKGGRKVSSWTPERRAAQALRMKAQRQRNVRVSHV